MSNKLINQLRSIVNSATQGTKFTALGLVNAYDPTGYQVQVLLQAETEDSPGSITGWIPVSTPWSGDQWGMFCPPSPGDLILVFFQDGSLQNPVAGMRLYFDKQRPLANPKSGELYFVHKSGSSVALTNDKKITITSSGGSSIVLTEDGKITINASSDYSITSSTKIDLNAPEINLNAPQINCGPTGGTFEPLLNVMSNPTVNLKAT